MISHVTSLYYFNKKLLFRSYRHRRFRSLIYMVWALSIPQLQQSWKGVYWLHLVRLSATWFMLFPGKYTMDSLHRMMYVHFFVFRFHEWNTLLMKNNLTLAYRHWWTIILAALRLLILSCGIWTVLLKLCTTHPLKSVGWNYSSIPNFNYIVGMDKWYNPMIYWLIAYLFFDVLNSRFQ